MAKHQGAVRIALALRQEMRDEGNGEFTQTRYRQRLADRLSGLQGQLFQSAVDGIAEYIDKVATSPRPSDVKQKTLWDLDGEYAMGNGGRIAKGRAQLGHADRAMILNDQNLIAVTKANAEAREELTRLRPYWGPGMSKLQAIAAWTAENSSESVA